MCHNQKTMTENADRISQLFERAEALMKRQATFQKEIDELHSELAKLKTSTAEPEIRLAAKQEPVQMKPPVQSAEPPPPVPVEEPKIKSNLEKFIGENLINKIGIAVTIIGVGIGAKYAIDHQLISPWTRIILGYLVGIGLFGFAFRLKQKYQNFSAVLLSGSMTIMYFITFAAYTFYNLIPVLLAFMLMVLFTVFTVTAAIKYNMQVVSLIGLVGAYAVPFLLSDGSGNVLVLFSYISLINIGILVIAFKKYWKILYYASFLLTWLIYLTWYIPNYKESEHFAIALVFVSVFFATFYIIFLAYKLTRKEKYEIYDILFLVANSGVFYGLGYATLDSNITSEGLTGLFTLGNAVIHFAVAAVIWFNRPADRGLLSSVTGLGLVFVTIAIPVQLNGNWVTLLWCGEAAALFWIGRTRGLAVYELLSYPLMFAVFLSIIHDWTSVYSGYNLPEPETRVVFIFNINFLTSLLIVFSFGFIQYFISRPKYISPLARQEALLKIMVFSVPAILLIILYCSFLLEISTFWIQKYLDSLVTTNKELTVPLHFRNEDLLKYSSISIFIYSFLFFSLLSFVNIKWIKNAMLGLFNLGISTILLGVFLTLGLYAIGELRESYLSQALSDFYYRGGLNIGIRYISFVFAGLVIMSVYKYVGMAFIQVDLKKEFDFLLHATILTILGNELINWMDLYSPGQSYKLGLSILFGVYALLLVALGIWKQKTHLRIAAIVLFAATLLKLFFYDLASLNTISKTIVFVILGVLLLVISFLYNKYKGQIFDNRGENRDKT
jgi:uncharacterized membrane protein